MSAITETNLPNLFHRGKVRDTYDLGEGLLLMVATDRLSAFDVVLPSGIPHKGPGAVSDVGLLVSEDFGVARQPPCGDGGR